MKPAPPVTKYRTSSTSRPLRMKRGRAQIHRRRRAWLAARAGGFQHEAGSMLQTNGPGARALGNAADAARANATGRAPHVTRFRICVRNLLSGHRLSSAWVQDRSIGGLAGRTILASPLPWYKFSCAATSALAAEKNSAHAAAYRQPHAEGPSACKGPAPSSPTPRIAPIVGAFALESGRRVGRQTLMPPVCTPRYRHMLRIMPRAFRSYSAG